MRDARNVGKGLVPFRPQGMDARRCRFPTAPPTNAGRHGDKPLPYGTGDLAGDKPLPYAITRLIADG